jgi:hypothetical protein
VWADRAYRSDEIEEKLAVRGLKSRIHRRAYRNRKLSEAQRAANTTRSNVRVRVEHVFGDQKNGMGTGIVRTIGIVRATPLRTAGFLTCPMPGEKLFFDRFCNLSSISCATSGRRAMRARIGRSMVSSPKTFSISARTCLMSYATTIRIEASWSGRMAIRKTRNFETPAEQVADAPTSFMGDGAYDRAHVLDGVLARNPTVRFVPPCKGAALVNRDDRFRPSGTHNSFDQ